MMRDHIATSLEIDVDDFDLTPSPTKAAWPARQQSLWQGATRSGARVKKVLAA